MVEVTVVSLKSPGSLRQLATYLARDKLALCAALFLLTLIACVLLGPFLVGDLAGKLGLRQRNLAPFSLQHGFIYILGADTLGRPILARLIVGALGTLGIAAAAVFCSPCLNTACTINTSSFCCCSRAANAGAVLRRRAHVSMFS